MDGGIFHDAHEVYTWTATIPRYWIATFATKELAEAYTEWASICSPANTYEAVPV